MSVMQCSITILHRHHHLILLNMCSIFGTSGQSAGKDVEWMDGKGEETVIWKDMLEKPNMWAEGTLMLRANMSKKS